MTFGQLKSTVASLGFENDIEDVTVFLNALSRALYMLYTDRPSVKILKIAKAPFPGRLLSKSFTHSPDGCENFNLRGRAISFAVSGKGKYTLRSGGVKKTEEFDTDMSHIRTLIGKDASISFEGEFGYTVMGLADIDSVRSDRLSDIPLWDERSSVNIRALCSDFMSAHKPPEDTHGRVIPSAYVSDGILTLPDDFSGEVILTYKRSPSMPGGLDGDERIDVPEELAELLPLAVASFVWLDDDPEKAQYYMSLYKDGIGTLRRFHPRELGSSYVTNGWA